MTDTSPTTENRQAAPLPEGVTLLQSGNIPEGAVEVPVAELAERVEYLTDLYNYIELMMSYVRPVIEAGTLPEDADDFLVPVVAGTNLAEAAQRFGQEILMQAYCGELIAGDVLCTKYDKVNGGIISHGITSVSRSAFNRNVRNQPRVDNGEYRRSKTWTNYTYERPDLPEPPEPGTPKTFTRPPRGTK